ncbi:MAG: hypothetical protein RR100_15070, partial [Comamonas sp.]
MAGLVGRQLAGHAAWVLPVCPAFARLFGTPAGKQQCAGDGTVQGRSGHGPIQTIWLYQPVMGRR